MNHEQRLYFRDAFRAARSRALEDSEEFGGLVFAFEHLGTVLNPKAKGLREKARVIEELAAESILAKQLPQLWPDYHQEFGALFKQMVEARNAAVHEGAFARHLTRHALVAALTVEDALMNGMEAIGDFMIRMPVCACRWHPLSFVRQTMLGNSFSYLPVNAGTEDEPFWRVVSDYSLASFVKREALRKTALQLPLGDAIDHHQFRLDSPYVCESGTAVSVALSNSQHLPILIISTDRKQLLGIATPFDLL